ncbi:hypothetical protein J27TS7_14510 [Paenibacillus dendritiformis]|nr:hypothetical protein J27TS7_14510 [Paenibacillus dendritiformis]
MAVTVRDCLARTKEKGVMPRVRQTPLAAFLMPGGRVLSA